MGAVLEQESGENNSKVFRRIFYWLSSFRDYVENYSISEKEALACVAAMNKFRVYLLGREFTLRTDHRAIDTLLSQKGNKIVGARTERWREKISIFNYNVEYIKCSDNLVTDWLSRSTTYTDHEEVPLAEEYVINEAKRRLEGRHIEYDLKMKELVKTVKETTRSKPTRRNIQTTLE